MKEKKKRLQLEEDKERVKWLKKKKRLWLEERLERLEERLERLEETKVQEVEEVIGVQGVGGAGVMEVIKVVEVKSSGDRRKNRSQDGPVPEKDQIQGRFYCDKCSKSYTEQKALMRHQKKRCRGEENDFKCGQCDKEYFHEEGLLEHLAANLQSQLIEKLLGSGTNLIGELSQN